MRGSAALDQVLRRSGTLAGLDTIAQSWFEDVLEVARAMTGRTRLRWMKLAMHLLQGVIGRRRDKWAEVIFRTASWMREGLPKDDPRCALAIVAAALADGRDVTEIGLMRDIALRTIAAARHRRELMPA